MKLFMMPHTVPNRPTNGEVAPMVASRPMPSRIRRASARTISAKLEAARSLMPLSLEMPADSRASRIAAASSDDSTLPFAPSANCASASDRASPILVERRAQLAAARRDSSIILAMKIVQVTSEAKARPIITALTRMSADMNIDHGDSSRSATAVDFGGLPSPSAGAAVSGAGVDRRCGSGRHGRRWRRSAWAARDRLRRSRRGLRHCGRRRRRGRATGAASAAPATAPPATASPARRSMATSSKRRRIHTSAQ